MLVEQAGDLNKLHNQVKKEAKELLEKAVATGDIRQALNVFMVVSDLLPRKDWIVSEEEYPLVRAYLKGWTERYSYVSFVDKFGEELYIVRKDPDPLYNQEPWDPQELEKATALAWEIVKNGYAGYTHDW